MEEKLEPGSGGCSNVAKLITGISILVLLVIGGIVAGVIVAGNSTPAAPVVEIPKTEAVKAEDKDWQAIALAEKTRADKATANAAKKAVKSGKPVAVVKKADLAFAINAGYQLTGIVTN